MLLVRLVLSLLYGELLVSLLELLRDTMLQLGMLGLLWLLGLLLVDCPIRSVIKKSCSDECGLRAAEPHP